MKVYDDFPITRHPPRWDQIPQSIHDEIKRYVNHGIPPSNFLNSILCEYKITAIIRAADYVNRALLIEIISFVYDSFPYAAFGSEKNVKEWIGNRGWQGQYNPDYSRKEQVDD